METQLVRIWKQVLGTSELIGTRTRCRSFNAMSDNEHPTQAIADLVTLHEEFGRLDDLPQISKQQTITRLR